MRLEINQVVNFVTNLLCSAFLTSFLEHSAILIILGVFEKPFSNDSQVCQLIFPLRTFVEKWSGRKLIVFVAKSTFNDGPLLKGTSGRSVFGIFEPRTLFRLVVHATRRSAFIVIVTVNSVPRVNAFTKSIGVVIVVDLVSAAVVVVIARLGGTQSCGSSIVNLPRVRQAETLTSYIITWIKLYMVKEVSMKLYALSFLPF